VDRKPEIQVHENKKLQVNGDQVRPRIDSNEINGLAGKYFTSLCAGPRLLSSFLSMISTAYSISSTDQVGTGKYGGLTGGLGGRNKGWASLFGGFWLFRATPVISGPQ
jgi:hypothetical protein